MSTPPPIQPVTSDAPPLSLATPANLPVTPDTGEGSGLPDSLKGNDDKTKEETSRTATKPGERTADDTQRSATEGTPVTGSTDQQPPGLSTSQRLWNAAYDNLKKGDDTAELVRSYVKTLTKVLEDESEIASDADVTIELEDPTKRQLHMKELVEKGQAKVVKASKITKGVGDFVDAILSIKPVVDLAIGNVPQVAPAALPWAGVCIGLQVSNLLRLFGFCIS